MKYNVYQPSLTGNEKKYVNECLDTTWISSKGHFINDFEKAFAGYIGVSFATGVCNGTVALHLAGSALGLGGGDEVIVPSFTYIASVNPFLQLGCKIVFCDSLASTWQMNVDDIRLKITPKTKAIIVVHLYGHPCNMDEIVKIAKEYNLFVIEDCAEAIGSEYKGQKVGSFGDIACFSFFGNKTITCGEGGMVLCNDENLDYRIKHLRGQGVVSYREYWHDVPAYNYRITNIQAAIGLAQFEQIDKFIANKIELATWYKEYLKDTPLEFHNTVGDVKHSYWMVSVLARSEQERQDLRKYLLENSIETRPTFPCVHLMPTYNQKYIKLPSAESISSKGINLPSYPALQKQDVKNICEVIKGYYKL